LYVTRVTELAAADRRQHGGGRHRNPADPDDDREHMEGPGDDDIAHGSGLPDRVQPQRGGRRRRAVTPDHPCSPRLGQIRQEKRLQRSLA